jgi:glycosyltransferase involved in cell wall biosynthesis
VLFTGRLDPNKGVDIAVSAVSKLRKKGFPVTLSVAGNIWFYRQKGAVRDPFQISLRAAMREVGVDWMGHVPRRFLPEVMRRHDVALVPSRSEEPFGLVVLESMASGLAVIASPRGGLGEACGGAAMQVDPDDAAGIERLLGKLSRNRVELDHWKARSLERAQTARWSSTAEVLCRAVGVETKEVQTCETLS